MDTGLVYNNVVSFLLPPSASNVTVPNYGESLPGQVYT